MARPYPSGILLDQERVALITGIFTGSSGEVTALAFRGMPNTILSVGIRLDLLQAMFLFLCPLMLF
ncbi:hypothetical protein [Pedobacter sp. GR22-10]|uniref:hypothetical protein n=1 Tax=Pedobacter TaxID=84567 RepID=UPI0022456692|nr:hypothetical protein [Pedobacter sp. GR22-10]MCX2429629.1 hypothetical protein [Pedobacter sp. GR22-10]